MVPHASVWVGREGRGTGLWPHRYAVPRPTLPHPQSLILRGATRGHWSRCVARREAISGSRPPHSPPRNREAVMCLSSHHGAVEGSEWLRPAHSLPLHQAP